VAHLREAPFSSFTVTSRQTTEDALVFDPIALGAIGALAIGFVAAALFAAVGFGVSAVVSARERLVEFSLLRAIGLSPRQLGRWLLAEQGLLVLVSLVLGTLLGLVLTTVLLPQVSLTQGGGRPVPEVVVQIPWLVIAALQLSLVVFLLIVVLVLTLLLRRVGLGRMVRLGEDR
jgi:ABC-type antimicrobial peptide transport system permease subunit